MATVILKKETDSLKNLMSYDISSDSNDSSDLSTNNVQALEDSASSSGSSDEDDFIPISVPDDNKGEVRKEKSTVNSTAALFGEMNIDLPLPDLSNLKINYDTEEFIHMGYVKAIIDTLVTVEALACIPAYDLDTILFIDPHTTKKPLGAVFDVIGPVASPIYCVRFKNREDLEKNEIKLDMQIYSAPKSELTRYVFVKELMRNKGTDASWLGDNEPPSDIDADSSEDEQIQYPPRIVKQKRGSFERHQHFERNMNRFNSFNTRLYNMAESNCGIGGFAPQPAPAISAPFFNPSIPPPGFADTVRRYSDNYHTNRNHQAGPSSHRRHYPL